jgi:hypothetical protein
MGKNALRGKLGVDQNKQSIRELSGTKNDLTRPVYHKLKGDRDGGDARVKGTEKSLTRNIRFFV